MKRRLLWILLFVLISLTAAGCSSTQLPEPSPGPSPEIIAPGCDSPDCNVSKPMTIHFLGMDGTWISEDRMMEWPPWGTSIEEFSIQEMLKGAADGTRIAPEDCTLVSVTTQDETCTLVFSSSFPYEDGASSLAAKSIAKTLFQYDYIKSIVIADQEGQYTFTLSRQ
jgi:hypothetical protein